MNNKSVLLKSIICGAVCLIFLLLLIFVVYAMDFFEGAFLLGLPCGAIIAFVTRCDTFKRTVVARLMGLVSAIFSCFIFEMLGVPYRMLMYVFRNDSFVRETGRLTVNETIGYGCGRMFFLGGLLIAFIITVISVFIFNSIKNHRSKHIV